MSDVLPDAVSEPIEAAARRYRHGEDRPVGSYLGLMTVYGALVAVLGLVVRRRGRALPSLSVTDVALVGVATYRVSRTIAKDPVMSPLRMPFTRYEGVSGPAELHEEVVSEGVGHAIGELLVCPFCLAQWVGTAFTAGLIFAPRATRLVAATMSAIGLADFLQYAYAAAQKVEG